MTNNNKILTVSYGTFSCTLEGFDDSFGTMKAIAEYFRDLAADDRYFGAEPPQPDAEMLARIAQREVSRKVEARQQDGKIVLSALEDHRPDFVTAPAAARTAAPVMAQPEHATVAEDTQSTTETLDLNTDLNTAEIDEVFETEASDIEVISEELIDSLQLGEATALDVVEPTVAEEEAVTPEATEDEADIVAGQPDAEVEAFFAETGSETAYDTDEAEQAPAAVAAPVVPAPAPDSIAAKLQRIRAVVAQQEDAAEDEDYLEDEHAEGQTAKALIAEPRTDIEDALDADDMEADTKAQDEEDEDEVSGILSRLEKLHDATPAAQGENPGLDDLDDLDGDDFDTGDDGMSIEDTVGNLFGENEDSLEVTKTVSAEKMPLRRTPRTTAPEAADSGTPEPIKASQPITRARVIKVKRADLEAAIEKGDLEEYDDKPAEDAVSPAQTAERPLRKLDELAPAKTRQTALSEEEEQDLARELAELEADISAGADRQQPQESTPRSATQARSVLPAIDDGNEADVNRLLAETDHQMDEPESATRRDAFAHLRAAVAAKKAEAQMGLPAKTEETGDAYRNDLAEVVRPRRPVSTSARTERPTEEGPAPLKLVAEQRIDVEKPRVAGPVRPRRVAAATVSEEHAETADGESFSDFAADMGASTLPQLLEAAAAYLSFVEGREQFSRPQLMSKVRQAGGQKDFSREDGLRSFGQLLRAGKIEKIKGGRFTVSQDIGYRPDERAAG